MVVMLWATHWQKLAQGKNPLRQHREAARWQLSVYLPPLDLKWQKKKQLLRVLGLQMLDMHRQ